MTKHIHKISKRDGSKEEEGADPSQVKGKDSKDLVNTNQYFRIANNVIKEKIDKLKRLQDGKKRFAEIEGLQKILKSKKDLDMADLKYITEDEAKVLIARLELDYEKIQDKLLCQELIIEKTRDEISAKRKQIDEIKEKLKETLQEQQKTREGMADPIEVLKEELKKAGINDKNQIYHIINDIAEELNMKNLKDQIRKN